MSIEQPKFGSTTEASGEDRHEGGDTKVERWELSQDEQERKARELMIEKVINNASEVDSEIRAYAADYIRKESGVWRQFKPGSLDVVDDWMENGIWYFRFRVTAPGEEDDRWEMVDKIPLPKE
jgi:hypothetical protein